MAEPTSTAEFVELVRRSGVVGNDRLDCYLENLPDINSNQDADLSRFAGKFVGDGLLTRFQAEQILQGRWKRFTIGKYLVLERLGSGGMGQVYLCEHQVMRRRVAIKVLPTAQADDPVALDRFYREARAVAGLDHPNLVRAFDIDEDHGVHFLVLEFVDGSSLQEILKRSGPLDPIRACHYIQQVAVGLDYAQRTASLVHRDIKPGNILVDRGGLVKVLDMGLARFFNDKPEGAADSDHGLVGTADYVAPEQALNGGAADVRSDIYSLGATFYFLLTGQPPFPEGSVAQKLIAHQSRDPVPLSQMRAHLPEGLEEIVARMMRKDPDERFQSPAEVAAALERLTQTPIDPPPPDEMPELSPAAGGSVPLFAPNRSSVQIQRSHIKAAMRSSAPSSYGGTGSKADNPYGAIRSGSSSRISASQRSAWESIYLTGSSINPSIEPVTGPAPQKSRFREVGLFAVVAAFGAGVGFVILAQHWFR
ncbi:MAG: serine/threonine protein kinase [Gemmataceae bacterium]